MRFSSVLLLLFFTPAESQSNDTGMNYGIDAFECDNEGNYREEKQKKKLGSVYQFCMTPNQAAKDAGVGIENLESWTWSYMSRDDEFHFQPVAEGKQAVPGLSSFHCREEGNLCIFNSFLTSDFYNDPGTVTGTGSVSLNGGTGSLPVHLDLFLKHFTIKLDPQLQEAMEAMKGTKAAEALAAIEDQAAQMYNGDIVKADIDKEKIGDAGSEEEARDADDEKVDTEDAGSEEL